MAAQRSASTRKLAKEISRYEGDTLPSFAERKETKKKQLPVLSRSDVTELVDYLTRSEIETGLGRAFSAIYSHPSDQAMLDGDPKVTIAHIRRAVKDDSQAVATLDGTLIKGRPVFDVAFERYQRVYTKSITPVSAEQKLRAKQRGAINRDVNRQFDGCIFKRVEETAPELISECLVDYDNAEAKYDRYRNVHKKDLRTVSYLKEPEQGHRNRAAVIKPRNHISDLPQALRTYLDDSYSDYLHYEKEMKALRKLLSATRESRSKELHREQRSKRRLSSSHGETMEEEYYEDL